MRVEHLGDGEPEVAIVGAIHGDEPCGARAIERLLDDDIAVDAPVKLVIANEAALERGVRYVDIDLNRAFDGDPGDSHEGRLARALAAELEGLTVLSIHSTRSTAEPFGIVNGTDGPVPELVPALSLAALVDIDSHEGRLFAASADLIEVEAGYQGSPEAAETAYRLARDFLTATGVLPGWTGTRTIPVFRLEDRIEKPPADEYEVLVENFTRVSAGQPFATADGDAIVAEAAFFPILMSADGYRDIFGYAGDRIGVLEPPSADTV